MKTVHCAFAMLMILLTAAAHAEKITMAKARELCAKENMGGRSPFGETTEETARKRLVFKWSCLVFVDGKPREAFDLYVAKDFCDHSHMGPRANAACINFDDSIKLFQQMAHRSSDPNASFNFSTSSSVNGELVTQWEPDADIYRVHDGKITEHWDAAPPKTITLHAQDKAFAEQMQQKVDPANTGYR
jgi:predicted SnoaL-like aldol condensation-catalyzing enzyme